MGPDDTKQWHPHPLLKEMWQWMESQGGDEAARRCCEKYRCVMDGNMGDWTFFFPVPETGKILELGGGFGLDTIKLAEQAAGIISVVPNIVNARIIKRHLCEKHILNSEVIVQRDITNLPLPDHSIAAIAMEAAAAPGFDMSRRKFPYVAAEWRRVLSPGGIVFLGLENPYERLPGFRLLRSRFHARGNRETLNRFVKKANRGPRRTMPGLRRTIQCMTRHGFGTTAVFSPLPDENKCEVAIPVDDPRAVHYFLNRLIRKNSPAIRIVISISNILVKHHLFHTLLPYYFLNFRLDGEKNEGILD